MRRRLLDFPRKPFRLRRCIECGYSLRGHAGRGRCPECGFSFDERTRVWYLSGPVMTQRTALVVFAVVFSLGVPVFIGGSLLFEKYKVVERLLSALPTWLTVLFWLSLVLLGLWLRVSKVFPTEPGQAGPEKRVTEPIFRFRFPWRRRKPYLAVTPDGLVFNQTGKPPDRLVIDWHEIGRIAAQSQRLDRSGLFSRLELPALFDHWDQVCAAIEERLQTSAIESKPADNERTSHP